MPDSPNTLYRRVGVTEFPYSGDDVDSTESAIKDTAQETLLALFRAAILDELGDAFTAAAANTPLAGKSVVEDTWPGLLTPAVMKQRQGKFPLLAVGWTGSAEWTEQTLGVDRVTRKWAVDYVLGPLEVGAAQKLEKLLHRVAVLMQLVIRNRGHKAYLGGATLWGDPEAGSLATLWLDSHQAGQASFAGGDDAPTYYALSAQLTSAEDDSFVDGIVPDLTGATFTVGVGGSDGALPQAVIAMTEIPLKEP